jgi:hypothetical protein
MPHEAHYPNEVHLTSTGVADPLANLHHVTEEEVQAAQNVVDATVGGLVGEDEEALRAGEEAAAAAMEGEILFVFCV